MNEQIEAMKKLGMTDEEIAEILEDDKKIDKGEKLFELSEEQKAIAKKATMTGTRAYTFTKRERKADLQKSDLISLLKNALSEVSTDIQTTNPERQLDFTVEGRKFRVVLSAPRK